MSASIDHEKLFDAPGIATGPLEPVAGGSLHVSSYVSSPDLHPTVTSGPQASTNISMPRLPIGMPSTPQPISLDRSPLRVIKKAPHVAISDQELRTRIAWTHRKSQHFSLSYDRRSFAEAQIESLLHTLEDAYGAIYRLTQETFDNQFQVYAIDARITELAGRALSSHLNVEEKAIYLVQSSSQHLCSELVCLLVHAMRIDRYTQHYGVTAGWRMLEDAFSIFLNDRVSTTRDIFPFYCADAALIAHRLYSVHLPDGLTSVWHTDDRPLTLEQGILAGAFLLYLGDTFGDDHVVRLSKADKALTSETFQECFGTSLADLEAAWVQHLPAALFPLTHDEQEEMMIKWERAIEGKHA